MARTVPCRGPLTLPLAMPLLVLALVAYPLLPAVTAERAFTLFVEGAGIDEMDPTWFNASSWMKIKKLNATANAYEWDLEILQDLPETTQSKWNMVEKVDGQYRPSSIRGSATVCEDLHSKRPTIKALGYPKSTLPKNCPIKKGLYSLRDNLLNENFFPAIVPGNLWRLKNSWLIDGKPILKFHLDIKIDRSRKLQG